MKRIIFFLFLFLSVAVFAQGKKIFISLGGNSGVFENTAYQLKSYIESHSSTAKVLVGEYALLQKVKPEQFDAIIIINADRTSGYAKEVEEFTQSFPAKEKVVISNWFKDYNSVAANKDPKLNGVDVITTSSLNRKLDNRNKVFEALLKILKIN